MSKEEREFREITADDVGKSMFFAFGRYWPVSSFIGAIMDVDVGKRVYRMSDHVASVENAEQFLARRTAEAKKDSPTNASALANLVYGFLSGKSGEFGIDLVRPPNPAHGNAVAVLFADGRDVVIRFEEQGGK